MTQEFVIDIAMEALKVTLLVSAPMLGFGLITGIVVSIFQAVTSIQEMTLTFIPKIIAVVAALFIFFPWLMQTMLKFTSKVIIIIPQVVR